MFIHIKREFGSLKFMYIVHYGYSVYRTELIKNWTICVTAEQSTQFSAL